MREVKVLTLTLLTVAATPAATVAPRTYDFAYVGMPVKVLAAS